MAPAESYPEDLRYHPEHDWARIEGGEAILGVTWYAQDSLGELVHYEPPDLAVTDAQVHAVVADVRAAAAEFGGTVTQESFSDATAFADAHRVAALLADAPVLDTGAGHDAGILAAAGVAASMLFVRNPTGVSHSPAEFAEQADCLAGIDALATVVARLAR